MLDQKTKLASSWQPSASIDKLKQRARLLEDIRQFFKERNIFEVETPLLSQATVTDPHIHSITATVNQQHCYLQTSPEYAMKRLLAAGSGSIYQICKAFRQDEHGRLHNIEFTLLEWYHLGFDHHALMNEVDELLQRILKTPTAERLTYENVFIDIVKINPHSASLSELKACAEHLGFQGELDRNGCLDILMTHCIEPVLSKKERPIFIYDYPPAQAALARIRPGQPALASRFEVYYRGIELGNGFHELQAAPEQYTRFCEDLHYREMHQLPKVPLDEHLLAALNNGLPDCAGIAMGIDRLIMLALGCEHIAEVLSFDFVRA